MRKAWFCGAAVTGLVSVLGSGPATAAPELLGDADLDRVVAGSVGEPDQLQQSLIETIVIPRLLALQQRLAGAGSELTVDIAALLDLLDYQMAPAAQTLGVAAARTAGAAPGPAVRSLLLRGPDASVRFFGASEGGQEMIDVTIIETANSASVSVTSVFSADQPGEMVRSSGISATAVAGN